MTDPQQTQVRPGEETLLAAVTNLVLSRKEAVHRSKVYLDGNDVTKVMKIIAILTEGPPEAERYGRPAVATDTIPTDNLEKLEAELTGGTPRRSLRARLDGQQPLPTE